MPLRSSRDPLGRAVAPASEPGAVIAGAYRGGARAALPPPAPPANRSGPQRSRREPGVELRDQVLDIFRVIVCVLTCRGHCAMLGGHGPFLAEVVDAAPVDRDAVAHDVDEPALVLRGEGVGQQR